MQLTGYIKREVEKLIHTAEMALGEARDIVVGQHGDCDYSDDIEEVLRKVRNL